mmetsp:Transcript_33843/g.75046  ORF Transcript_33843/g.75046 Transcript_33843/m.75046 type:complete len:242 (-) Transcript_33843:868-1593(-)
MRLKGAAAQCTVTQPVIESAELGACQVHLPAVLAACVVEHLAKVPGLAVYVDGLAIHPVLLQRQCVQARPHLHQGAQHEVAHDVKAEAVNPVVLCPVNDVIHHQPLTHGVLSGRVVAARGLAHLPVLQTPVVVAGNNLVKHAVPVVGPRPKGVVVHHIRHHPPALGMQGLHHLPVLQDTAGAIRVCGIAALGHAVVHGVIAPVESILVRHRQHRRLLHLTVGGVAGQVILHSPLLLRPLRN